MPHRVLNQEEVARYLHVPIADVAALVKRREIPFEKQGGRLVFRKREVETWASQRIMRMAQAGLREFDRQSQVKTHDLSRGHANVSELLRKDRVDIAMASRTKPSLIRDIARLADGTGLVNDPAGLVQSLQEREKLCSTALARGVALLHPRNHDAYAFEDSFLCLARAASPLPFGAIDGTLTDIFFLVCCQDDRIHLHVLARICMMCAQTRLLESVREAPDSESVCRAVEASESEIIKGL